MINIKYIKNIISQALNKVDIFYGNIYVKAVIDYFSEHKKERKDMTVIIGLKIYTIFYFIFTLLLLLFLFDDFVFFN